MTIKEYAGFVAVIGRPNVGKSTLMNRLVGEKVSITSKKAQTTRHCITGVRTEDNYQAIFVDTPGMHLRKSTLLNKRLNKSAMSTLSSVDLILFVVSVNKWTVEDDFVLKHLKSIETPILLVVNKVDNSQILSKSFEYVSSLNTKMDFKEIIPVSAKTEFNLDKLNHLINQYLPENFHLYDAQTKTDRGFAFRSAELVREQLVRHLGEELPHQVSVQIEQIKREDHIVHVYAKIWVVRDSHKAIIIGHRGEMLKKIGIKSRVSLEHLFGKKVNLKLWVKVKENWTANINHILDVGALDKDQ